MRRSSSLRKGWIVTFGLLKGGVSWVGGERGGEGKRKGRGGGEKREKKRKGGEGLTGLPVLFGDVGWAEDCCCCRGRGGGWWWCWCWRERDVGCAGGWGRKTARVWREGFGQGQLRVHLHDGDDLAHLEAAFALVAVLDKARPGLGTLLRVPGRGERLLAGEELAPPLEVVEVPEEELERLGVVLDVEEIVHEVVQRAGLWRVSTRHMTT